MNSYTFEKEVVNITFESVIDKLLVEIDINEVYRDKRLSKDLYSPLKSVVYSKEGKFIGDEDIIYFKTRKEAWAFIKIVESNTGIKLPFSVNSIFKSK